MQRRHRSRAKCLAICIVLPLAAACASNTVKPIAEAQVAPRPRPPSVLVYDPLLHDPGSAHSGITVAALVDKHDDHVGGVLGQQATHVFAAQMVRSISHLGLRAVPAGRNTPIPEHGVVVVGQLIAVKKGNNFERLVVGLGAGQSRIDMRVSVYEVGDAPIELLELRSHADSGQLPGAAITVGGGAVATGGLTAVAGVGALAGAGIKTYRYAVEELAKRSARHASAYMSGYFARQRWIARSSVKKPTPMGHVLDLW
jgi:hypothetical protein